MDIEIPDIEQSEIATKPRAPRRQPKVDRRVWVYKVVDGKNSELGSFPESTVGSPVERRIPAFVQEMFGTGEYKVDLRTAKGVPERTYPISIADNSSNHDNAIDAEFEDVDDAETFDDFQPPGYGHVPQPAAGLTQAEVENILLKERLQMMEQQQQSGSTNNNILLSMLQTNQDRERAFMQQQIDLLRAASSQPREDPMASIERAFNMVSKARDFTEAVAPSESSGESSWLADGAKLVESLGKVAGPVMPVIASMLTQPPASPQPYGGPVPPPLQQNTGREFADLAAAAKTRTNGNKASEEQKS